MFKQFRLRPDGPVHVVDHTEHIEDNPEVVMVYYDGGLCCVWKSDCIPEPDPINIGDVVRVPREKGWLYRVVGEDGEDESGELLVLADYPSHKGRAFRVVHRDRLLLVKRCNEVDV